MRTVEEIRYEMRGIGEIIDDRSMNHLPLAAYAHQYKELKYELYEALADGIPLDRLTEICSAEKDGRVVVMPCKVGGTVWFYEEDGKLDCARAIWFESMLDKWTVTVQNPPRGPKFFNFDDFGKTVFLTPAEAKEKLKGAANDRH